MSLQNAKQTTLHEQLAKDEEPTLEQLEREHQELLKEIKDKAREAIKLSEYITRKKKYREWIK